MKKHISQLEFDQKISEVTKAFRDQQWDRILRFLLEEAGVKMCPHGYATLQECRDCNAELDKWGM